MPSSQISMTFTAKMVHLTSQVMVQMNTVVQLGLWRQMLIKIPDVSVGTHQMMWYVTMIKKQILLSSSLCMTYDESSNDTVIGKCPFNYHYPNTRHLYITLPNDISQLNSFMCGDMNRTGLLCSKCQQALGPAVLSYRPQCVECLDGWYGWLVYTAAALLPCFPQHCFALWPSFPVSCNNCLHECFSFSMPVHYMCKCTSFNSKYLSWLHWCFKSFTLSVYNSTHFLWTLEFRFLPIFHPSLLYQQSNEHTQYISTGVRYCNLSTFFDGGYLSLYWDVWQGS